MMKTIEDLQDIVDKEICKHNQIPAPKELYEPIWYTLQTGGKRLRPVLVLLGCQLFDDDIQKAILPAIGIEMFHNFTLLHDDIMDQAFLRRNRPTVHIKWDINRAILSGDAFAIKANMFIASCSPEVLPGVLNVFNTTALQVCEGQQYDLNFELIEMASEEEYLQMIRLKTAVLLAGSLQIGALIGGADKTWAQRTYDFGYALGMAFQLQDDLLDTFGDPEKFGKTIGGDIATNKKTYLVIKAHQLANKKQKRELTRWYTSKESNSDHKIAQVKTIFRELGVDRMTSEMVHIYSKEALDILDEIPVSEERKGELSKFTYHLMDRVK